MNDGDWKEPDVSVDSGAVTTVGPRRKCTTFLIEPTEASRSGKHLYGANGSVIRTYGVRMIQGLTEEGRHVKLPIQVADVIKGLVSVSQLIHTGTRVVLTGTVAIFSTTLRVGSPRRGPNTAILCLPFE